VYRNTVCGFGELVTCQVILHLAPFEKKENWNREKPTSLVSDTIAEMEWWDAFKADDGPKRSVPLQKPMTPVPQFSPIEEDKLGETVSENPPNAVIRRGPKIGRNDPCPCGSGRKYKKCCLGK
jgi:preprotein translocase subunit SecA